MPSKKSTNVRSYTPPVPSLLRLGLETVGTLAPSLAGMWAARIFVTAPPRQPSHLREQEVLAKAETFHLQVGQQRLAALRWGTGPVVVLVHGWGGRGSQLSSFVEPLVRAGFGVVAFDGPAHGASDGRTSSLPGFARALSAVIREVGPVHAVVAHSMGAAACMLAIRQGASVPRAVFLAPPANAHDFFEKFATYFSLRADVARAAEAHLERRLRMQWSELEARAMASEAGSRVPLLVFHDQEDKDVAWANGAKVAAAWPGAELVTTKGLGHFRILRDANVITDAVRFLVRGAADCHCEQCELERELFDRSSRFPRMSA